MRACSDLQRNALKTAWKRLLQQAGGLEAAACCTRVAKTQLSTYGDVHRPDQHAPVDVVLDLELIVEAPLLTEALAAAQGYALLPLRVGEGDIADKLAQISVDAGRTMADAARALRDGMPPAERNQVIADITELHRHAGEALGALRGVSDYVTISRGGPAGCQMGPST